MADVRNLQQLVLDRLTELGDRRGPMSTRQAALRSRGQVSYETLRLLAKGEHSGRLEEDTVAGLALALDVPRSRILAAMGQQMLQPLPPFELPKRAQQLSRAQRKVVLAVVEGLLSSYEHGREAAVQVPPGSGKTGTLTRLLDGEATAQSTPRAARTGQNRGRARRAELDRQAETPPPAPQDER